jgi:hypothetical protein
VPLGLADHLVWERDAAECGKKHRRKQRPISDQESRKWLHSLEKTAQLHKDQPDVHLVNIADREGDICSQGNRKFFLILQSRSAPVPLACRQSSKLKKYRSARHSIPCPRQKSAGGITG